MLTLGVNETSLYPPLQMHKNQDNEWTGTADICVQGGRDAKLAKKILDKKGGISAHNLAFVAPRKSQTPTQPRGTTIFEKIFQW